MKIYRVVPDSFCTCDRLVSTITYGLEDIYYKMGYTSFLGERGCHESNNLYKDITEEGKYFYLFAEDAIKIGYSLLCGYHGLELDSFFVVEYDVDEDLILKNIGCGNYSTGLVPIYLMETYINKSDLGTRVLTTKQISTEAKLDQLATSLMSSLNSIKEFGEFSMYDTEYYYELLEIDDKQEIRDIIINTPFYDAFLYERGQLIESPYITGKIITVNPYYIFDKYDYFDSGEYFKPMGIRYDVDEAQIDFKDELIKCVSATDRKDKERVKSLLMERKYI